MASSGCWSRFVVASVSVVPLADGESGQWGVASWRVVHRGHTWLGRFGARCVLRRPPWKRLSFETQSWLQKCPPPNASAKRPNTLSESELAVHVSAAGSLNCAMETAAKDLLRNSPVAWPHFHSSVLTL